MKNKSWYVLLAIIVSLSITSHSFAADCAAVKKGIKAESNLKLRRKLVAEAIVQCPEDPHLNYKYGLSLERFRKYDKALSYYQKALLYDPQMGKAYTGMGDVFIFQGSLDNAIKAYRKGVELKPGDSRLANRLARLEIKKKALDGGVVTGSEFIKVMDQRGKISTNIPLLLTGPALQYDIAFVAGSDNLLPLGIRQLAGIGGGMQNDSLREVRFELSSHDESTFSSLGAMEDSKVRAQILKDQLVTNFQIDPKRIDIVWYGDTLPLELPGGHKLRERVEIKRIRAE